MKQKKWLSMAVVLIVAVTILLAGCGKSNDQASPSDNGTSSSPATEETANKESQPAANVEPVEIEVIEKGDALPDPKDDFVKQEIDKALGTDLKLTTYTSGDDFKNQLNVRMVSGNVPDLFAVDKAQIKTFAGQGLLLDLNGYLDKLKPTVDFVKEESLTKGMYDGKIYAIPKAQGLAKFSLWVRKDWLETLKLEVPKTTEDLLAVAKAFTENDPDGNGSKDTYGYTGAGLGALQPIFGAFGVGSNGKKGSFYEEDGKIVNSLYDPGMKEALAFINKLFDAGVADPELLANNGSKSINQAIQGKAGIIYVDWAAFTKPDQLQQMKTVNPNAEWIQIEPPVGPEGYQFDGIYDFGGGGLYAIPKSLEKDPDTLNKVFDLLNYVSTDGSKLVQFGVEGRHYNLTDGKVVPTELMAKEAGYTWNYQFTGRPEMEYLQVKFAPQSEYIEFAAGLPRVNILDGFVSIPDGYNPADADRYIEEETTKFIFGKRALSEYDQFLNTLETTFKYKTFLDSATKQLNDLGYGK